jgi:stearoyl-CoA desaturase (delta-9 desaturase)
MATNLVEDATVVTDDPNTEEFSQDLQQATDQDVIESSLVEGEMADIHDIRPLSPEMDELLSGFSPEKLQRKHLDWPVILWMIGIHLGCLVAPFFFSWQALGLTIFMHWLTCSVGICLGYHRYLSHRSMTLNKPANFFVTLCGVLAGEGDPLTWAANHRLHHQRSDLKGDPHSPFDGSWWSHILWTFVYRNPEQDERLFQRYIPDLANNSMYRFFHRTFGMWIIGAAVATTAAGYALGAWMGADALFMAGSFFFWAVCVRMALAYHSTWFVNSATHLWGYRNYETNDKSKNLWWVALVAYGEGWHNNHHAHPRLAKAGHRWYEIDMTYWTIKLLQLTGMATKVHNKLPEQQTAANATES